MLQSLGEVITSVYTCVRRGAQASGAPGLWRQKEEGWPGRVGPALGLLLCPLRVPWFTFDLLMGETDKRSHRGSCSPCLPCTLHLHLGHGALSKLFKGLGSSDVSGLH